jgi:hypothetical protein
MLWLKYFLLLPFFLMKGLARPILPWIVVPFFSTPDKLHLRRPFEWFDTIDNPLTGDEGWQTHLWYGDDPMHVLNRIGWLIRNGGNRLSYTFFGCDADDPHPFYRPYIPLWNGWRWDVMLGWNVKGQQQGRAKYCFVVFRFKKNDKVEHDEGWSD